MNVSTPVGKVLASLVILAAVVALEALPTPILDPVDEYLSFVLTEDLDFERWVASAQDAYDGLWNRWGWSAIPTLDDMP